jgi:hypothetical protein
MEKALDGLHPLGLALDVQLVATRGHGHVESALDAPQVLVVGAKKSIEPLFRERYLRHLSGFFEEFTVLEKGKPPRTAASPEAPSLPDPSTRRLNPEPLQGADHLG